MTSTDAAVPGSLADSALGAAEMGVWEWDATTDRLTWDERTARLMGIDPEHFDGRRKAFLARIHPGDLLGYQRAIARSKEQRAPFAHEFRVVRPDGSTAWVQGRGQVLCDEQGAPARMIGVALDTTSLQSSRERAARALHHVSEGFLVLDPDWTVSYVNDPAATILGVSVDDLLGRVLWDALPGSGDSRFRTLYQRAVDSRVAQSLEARYGSTWFEVRCLPTPDGLTVYFRNVSERREAERERALLLDREQTARREAEAAHERLLFLASASEALAGSLRRSEVLDTIVELAVPRLADWSLVYLEEGGLLRRVALKHADPAMADVVAEVLGTDPVPVHVDTQVTRTFRTGAPELALPRPEDFTSTEHLPRFAQLVAQMGAVSAMSIPLRAGGRVRGVLIFTSATPERVYTEDDVALGEELARRATVAVENATRFEREHSTAVALQRAILPEELPSPAGFDLGSLYLPATSHLFVGGDWYDAFLLGPDRLGLVLGDVGGHGIQAASIMGQLRNSLRAYALEGYSPSEVMSRLDRLRSWADDDVFATAVYATVDLASGEVVWCSAGHPPLLHVGKEGVRYLDEVHSPLLGVSSPVPYEEGRTTLLPGDVLVAYSDGAVERRVEDIDTGLARLAAAATPSWTTDLTTRLETISREVLGAGPSDDVCLLALRRR